MSCCLNPTLHVTCWKPHLLNLNEVHQTLINWESLNRGSEMGLNSAMYAQSSTIVHFCGLFGPLSKRNFRLKMTTIVGQSRTIVDKYFKPPFAKPPFRLSWINVNCRGFAKAWFPKGCFWQMLPCTEMSYKKSFPAVLPWQKKAMIFDVPGPKTQNKGISAKTALLFPLESDLSLL